VGDKVTAREMLLDEAGEVLAKPGDKLVVMEREGTMYTVWRNNRRGKVPGHKLRKGYSNRGR
jgi:hypothetical protein